MIVLTSVQDGILDNNSMHFSYCWKIIREDGFTYRFTDYHSPINLGTDPIQYKPAAYSTSAMEAHDSLNVGNLEAISIIDDEALTDDDLYTQKLVNAQVYCYLFDWRIPFTGAIRSRKYWVSDISFSNEKWTIQLSDINRFIQRQVGSNYGYTCRYEFGDSDCGLSTDANTIDSNQLVITTQRKVFRVLLNSSLGVADNYTYGRIYWLSGANAGTTSYIRKHTVYGAQTGIIYLETPTQFDIAVGDVVRMTRGCGKNGSDCKAKFIDAGGSTVNNFANFGGFPYIPGTARAYQTPGAR